MKIAGELVEGRFVARDNRFRVTVEVDGQRLWAHLPNSGRLSELLVPGRRVVLVHRASKKLAKNNFQALSANRRVQGTKLLADKAKGRKTDYDLNLVEMEGRWVLVDARLPNDLVEEALRSGRLAPLAGYPTLRREVPHGRSRFDFQLAAPDRPLCLVEVKSVTLVVDGLGCFPDAVTLRGRRHLNELAEAVQAGYRAAVVFCLQRDDAAGLRPHDEADPGFGRALREAARKGVEVYAYACRVEPGRIEITHPLPVYLEPD